MTTSDVERIGQILEDLSTVVKRLAEENRKLRMTLMLADALAEGYAQQRSKDSIYWRYVSSREDLIKEARDEPTTTPPWPGER